uniref:Uncharacterized protein n=1 Tax=Coccidioides posadasii RMSCC 3488 TaxID=454284 RepID=A0A0J6IHI7_COCPO|nr:hypothetical protein CPAG_07600 [Coccidioides posadasii RMSCC 3488]
MAEFSSSVPSGMRPSPDPCDGSVGGSQEAALISLIGTAATGKLKPAYWPRTHQNRVCANPGLGASGDVVSRRFRLGFTRALRFNAGSTQVNLKAWILPPPMVLGPTAAAYNTKVLWVAGLHNVVLWKLDDGALVRAFLCLSSASCHRCFHSPFIFSAGVT